MSGGRVPLGVPATAWGLCGPAHGRPPSGRRVGTRGPRAIPASARRRWTPARELSCRGRRAGRPPG
eukprot:14669288-Heterocapsa_arctica.AAC.1